MLIANWLGTKRVDDAGNRGRLGWTRGGNGRGNGRFTENGRRSSRFSLDPLFEAPPSPTADRAPDRVRDGSVRVLNVVVALLGILLTAPLMLVMAVAVKLSSPGPALFTQPRVGVDRRRDDADVPIDPRRRDDRGGRIFRIYKFRTMYHCEDGSPGQVWATPEDPRVTPVGNVLRAYRLDELPQLFNVLLGDMNIVGPRPEQPDIFKDLRDRIEGYQERQRVLPGITGLAQVNHRYDQSVEDVRKKVHLDLEYVQRRSLREDLRIMVRTFPVILFRRGSC